MYYFWNTALMPGAHTVSYWWKFSIVSPDQTFPRFDDNEIWSQTGSP